MTLPPKTMADGAKVLLTQLQTLNNNGADQPWLTVAAHGVDANGADLALERSESTNGSVTTAEQIGYAAFSDGHNASFISNDGSTIQFKTSLMQAKGWENSCSAVDAATENAIIIASKSSRNGGDGGWARRCQTRDSIFALAIDEDIHLDLERGHISETVSLVSFSKAFVAQFDSEEESWQMEAGQLSAPSTSNDPSFSQVQFQQQYDQPPVVIMLPGSEDSDSVSVRIQNVTSSGFDMRLVEPSGDDDQHIAQTLHYLALTPGTHALPGGDVVTAGIKSTQAVQFRSDVSAANTTKSWSHIQFREQEKEVIDTEQNGLNAKSAARFLTQATFGVTDESIDQLIDTGSYEGWIKEQMALPVSYQLQSTQSYWLKTCPLNKQGQLINSPSEIVDTWQAGPGRHNIWWQSVLHGEDQLRQRIAFALSQIFVVSDKPQMLEDSQFGMTSYYDILLKHAFGNYRDLLEDVTLHPAMGLYLGVLRNQKANTEENIRPDENYAREVLQLFSMGVHQLNIDGTLKLENGQLIPTYNQQTIQEFARVFTGWNYADIDWKTWIGRGSRVLPMIPVEQFHDQDKKVLLNGLELPAKQNARADLKAALDNIFNHPNVGPFISKQLIQRLVTSNPTGAYVARVARVFNNNDNGVRGDLSSVVTAILLDEEARNGHQTIPAFGKLKEPLLRLSHLYRALDLRPSIREGSFWKQQSCGRGEYPVYVMGQSWSHLANLETEIGQAALRSPSVFNFYRPDYSPSGVDDLVAPEFQLATENFIVNTANLMNHGIYWAKPLAGINQQGRSWLDFSHVAALADNTDDLLNHLSRVLLNGAMSDQLRGIISRHLADPDFQYHNDSELDKARDAIVLILISPEYLIQK
jgi:uncharacterized protein (DUF1800 family)